MQKKQRFTVYRKIAELKGVSLEKIIKLNTFLSVFSSENYIFENLQIVALISIIHLKKYVDLYDFVRRIYRLI